MLSDQGSPVATPSACNFRTTEEALLRRDSESEINRDFIDPRISRGHHACPKAAFLTRFQIGRNGSALMDRASWTAKFVQIRQNSDLCSAFCGDVSSTSAGWSSQSTEEVAMHTRKTGNHVCRADVCHKGRIGEKGFCRMFYWHWARCVDEKKGVVSSKMTHGLQLQERWNGSGDPPVHRVPPLTGLPALEMTQPFHFKMTPAMLLGPVWLLQ